MLELAVILKQSYFFHFLLLCPSLTLCSLLPLTQIPDRFCFRLCCNVGCSCSNHHPQYDRIIMLLHFRGMTLECHQFNHSHAAGGTYFKGKLLRYQTRMPHQSICQFPLTPYSWARPLGLEGTYSHSRCFLSCFMASPWIPHLNLCFHSGERAWLNLSGLWANQGSFWPSFVVNETTESDREKPSIAAYPDTWPTASAMKLNWKWRHQIL